MIQYQQYTICFRDQVCQMCNSKQSTNTRTLDKYCTWEPQLTCVLLLNTMHWKACCLHFQDWIEGISESNMVFYWYWEQKCFKLNLNMICCLLLKHDISDNLQWQILVNAWLTHLIRVLYLCSMARRLAHWILRFLFIISTLSLTQMMVSVSTKEREM